MKLIMKALAVAAIAVSLASAGLQNSTSPEAGEGNWPRITAYNTNA